jgi:hypothetical protein
MKFNVPEISKEQIDDPIEVCMGDVYPSKNQRKTFYWLVIGLTGNMVHCLGLDADGQITSTTSYGKHVFEGQGTLWKGRKRLGRVDGLDTLDFDIIWDEQP